MSIFINVIGFITPFICFFVVGIAFWAIGQHLRKRGFAERLDKIDRLISFAKQITTKKLKPHRLGIGILVGVGRGLSKMPLVSSKSSREIWETLERKSCQLDKSENIRD